MPTRNGRPPRRDTCSSKWLELWFHKMQSVIAQMFDPRTLLCSLSFWSQKKNCVRMSTRGRRCLFRSPQVKFSGFDHLRPPPSSRGGCVSRRKRGPKKWNIFHRFLLVLVSCRRAACRPAQARFVPELRPPVVAPPLTCPSRHRAAGQPECRRHRRHRRARTHSNTILPLTAQKVTS
jgi:hypothetical protein